MLLLLCVNKKSQLTLVADGNSPLPIFCTAKTTVNVFFFSTENVANSVALRIYSIFLNSLLLLSCCAVCYKKVFSFSLFRFMKWKNLDDISVLKFVHLVMLHNLVLITRNKAWKVELSIRRLLASL